MAAAQLAVRPSWTIDELVRALAASPLDTLARGDRADLRTILSWSCRTLRPDAARMLRLLGQHPGETIQLTDACALAGTPPELTSRVLTELVESHLLTERGPARYVLHDLVRSYALELCDQAELVEAKQRLFAYFVHSGQNAMTAMGRPMPLCALTPAPSGVTPLQFTGAQDGLAWLDAIWSSVEALVRDALDHAMTHTALELTQTLFMGFFNHNAPAELLRIFTLPLPHLKELGDVNGYGVLLFEVGGMQQELGNLDQGMEAIKQAIRLFEQTGHHRARSDALDFLSSAYHRMERVPEAVEPLEQSLRILQEHGDDGSGARKLNNLAATYVMVDRHADAIAPAQQAVQRCAGVDRILELYAWETLGDAQFGVNLPVEAAASYEAALTACHSIAARREEPRLLLGRARLHEAAGERDAAFRSATRALDIIHDADLDRPALQKDLELFLLDLSSGRGH
jgi:tetratricopeptide (TPR) repeat protein